MQRPMTKTDSTIITGQSTKSRSHPTHSKPLHEDDDDMGEDKWSRVARLSVGGLSQQGRVIREICRDAIRIVEVTLVTVNAWPELHKGTLYKRHVLLEAVNTLRANNKDHNEGRQDADYEAVRTRILEDDKFIRTIGKWVRISIFFADDFTYIYHVLY